VITAMNARPVRGLRDFSDVLKTLKPGDGVSLTLTREGKEMTVSATLRAK
jgi:S1-C subfamily serine protease